MHVTMKTSVSSKPWRRTAEPRRAARIPTASAFVAYWPNSGQRAEVLGVGLYGQSWKLISNQRI